MAASQHRSDDDNDLGDLDDDDVGDGFIQIYFILHLPLVDSNYSWC
jgi:hypothetical protein